MLTIWNVSLASVCLSSAQSADTVQHYTDSTLKDPVANRLFLMSTGELASPGSFFIGTHAFVAYQAGWAPTDLIQLNCMFNLLYVSAAIKIHLLENTLRQPALALGLEFANTTNDKLFHSMIYAVNVAATHRLCRSSFHINILQPMDPSGKSWSRVPTLVQLGFEYLLMREDPRPTKLIAELGLLNKYETEYWGLRSERFGLPGVAVGLRNFGTECTWEIGLFTNTSNLSSIGTSDTKRGIRFGIFGSIVLSYY